MEKSPIDYWKKSVSSFFYNPVFVIVICLFMFQFIDDYSTEYDVDRDPNIEFKLAKSRPSVAGTQNRGFNE